MAGVDPNKCSVVIYPDANYNGVPIAHYSTDSTGGQTFSLPNAVENDVRRTHLCPRTPQPVPPPDPPPMLELCLAFPSLESLL